MAYGADAKSPDRNLPIMIVARFWAVAHWIAKIDDKKRPPTKGHLRPRISEAGPKIWGPKAKPMTCCQDIEADGDSDRRRTKIELAKVATTDEMLNCLMRSAFPPSSTALPIPAYMVADVMRAT